MGCSTSVEQVPPPSVHHTSLERQPSRSSNLGALSTQQHQAAAGSRGSYVVEYGSQRLDQSMPPGSTMGASYHTYNGPFVQVAPAGVMPGRSHGRSDANVAAEQHADSHNRPPPAASTCSHTTSSSKRSSHAATNNTPKSSRSKLAPLVLDGSETPARPPSDTWSMRESERDETMSPCSAQSASLPADNMWSSSNTNVAGAGMTVAADYASIRGDYLSISRERSEMSLPPV